FAYWERGTALPLQRNETYRDHAPYFERAPLGYFRDPTALYNALPTDRIAVIATVQAPEPPGRFEGDDLQLRDGPTNGEQALSVNHGAARSGDPRVRQAARHATDHQTLLDTCWAGRGTLIGSMVPPTDPWYEDRTGDYPYDVERAT